MAVELLETYPYLEVSDPAMPYTLAANVTTPADEGGCVVVAVLRITRDPFAPGSVTPGAAQTITYDGAAPDDFTIVLAGSAVVTGNKLVGYGLAYWYVPADTAASGAVVTNVVGGGSGHLYSTQVFTFTGVASVAGGTAAGEDVTAPVVFAAPDELATGSALFTSAATYPAGTGLSLEDSAGFTVLNAATDFRAYLALDPDPDALTTWNLASGAGAPLIEFGAARLLLTAAPPSDAPNCECVDERPDRTLLELRTSLLRRLGYSAQIANPPPGMAELLDDFLRDAQEQLYERFTAMRTERYFKWTMVPGVRFYGIRANEGLCDLRLDPYKITWVGIEDDRGTWTPLHPGIHATLYTGLQRGMPSRYEIRQCIEVYPPPDRAYTLRVKGHFGLTPLIADTDQTTLPSAAVFLLALANAKAHYGQADAGNYFGQANSYLGGQVAGSHMGRRYVPGAAPQVPWTKPRILGIDDE